MGVAGRRRKGEAFVLFSAADCDAWEESPQ